MKKTHHKQFGPSYAVVNLSKIGFRYFRILLKTKNPDELSEKLGGNPSIGWIFRSTGWFDLGVGIWARDNHEIIDVSTRIRSILGAKDKIVYQSELTSLIGFGNGPLSTKRQEMPIIDASSSKIDLTDDEVDYLKLVTLDDSWSNKAIADLLELKTAQVRSIQVRLKKLGVIVGKQKRIDYGGYYYKVFIDTSSVVSEKALTDLEESLWSDKACIYFERANGKYDLEFELVAQSKRAIQKYLKGVGEFQVAMLTENLHTNLLPTNKITDLGNLKKYLKKNSEGEYDLRDSKLWYMNKQGANAYLDIYENEKYFELMNRPELDLFKGVADAIKRMHPSTRIHLADLGSGDGMKGAKLVKAFGPGNIKTYYPVDISPIEILAAVNRNKDLGYEVKPVVLDFENIATRLPFTLLPGEIQVSALLGGTYGNFDSAVINSYLSKIVGGASLLIIASPHYPKRLPKEQIMESYASMVVENIAFGPLQQLGFRKKDFEFNTKYKGLRVHLEIDKKRNHIMSFVLGRSLVLGGKSFTEGDVFKMTSSWKPSLKDFEEALSDFAVHKIVKNDKMAIAIVGS